MSERSYRVAFTTAAVKELRKLDPGIRRRLVAGIAELEADPRTTGCKKLVGEESACRIRVGDCRVIYEIAGKILLVTGVRVAHRREVYG